MTQNQHARPIAQRLAGPALVRFSSAWWKRHQWPDVLGCALRFTTQPESTTPAEGDQDLLLATVRRPWTLALAPLSTRVDDFLANRYYAVSPFAAEGLGRVEWRLRPSTACFPDGSRTTRLEKTVHSGQAELILEYSHYRSPLHVRDERSFAPLVRILLVERLELDQAELRFDPFRTGRGIAPFGFVHALRPGAYRASQAARPRQMQDERH